MSSVIPTEACHQRGIEVFNRVIQQLDHVLGIVCECAGILHRHLVVVGRPHQARRKGIVPVLTLIGCAVVVGVYEEVRIRMCIVNNGRPGRSSISPQGSIQNLLKAGDLVVDGNQSFLKPRKGPPVNSHSWEHSTSRVFKRPPRGMLCDEEGDVSTLMLMKTNGAYTESFGISPESPALV